MSFPVGFPTVTAVEDETRRPERLVGLATTTSGRPVPLAAERAVNPLHRLGRRERLSGWLFPLGVTLLAFGLRLVHLGTPNRFAFDETYYAKDAWSLLNNGYVQTYVKDVDGNAKNEINDDILAGHTHDVWTGDPSLAVHPDVGKWLIALGEKAFGMDPFGWRIASAVAGALMVLVICRLVRRMTGSTLLGCVAGTLLMLDGLHFVLSRLALLDIFLALFLLCAVACLVADRDWHRARLARRTASSGSWGPRILLRPWLLAAGVCFGLAIGTKWTALYPLAAFGVLCWLWSAGARRLLGIRWAVAKGALADGLPAFVHLVVVAALVYIATWGGWLAHVQQYEEHLSSTQYRQYTGQGHCAEDDDSFVATDLDENRKWPTATEKDASGIGEAWQSLRSLWYYHQDVYTFHTHFLNCSEHFYDSKPSSWLLVNRPVGVAVTNDIKPTAPGCDAPADSHCIKQVLLMPTPVLWWGGVLALMFAVLMWLGARDWRYGVAVVGALSTWLPWLQYDERPIFLFYAIAILPFTVIALTLTIGTLIGPSRLPSARRTAGVVVGGAFVILTLVNFAWFWPIFTNQMITHSEWLDRVWFSRWV
ncbi:MULTISPECIES: dolichyl-phosphate-mannose--protein mannosyltransferase [Nocardioides]|uniref:Polyprenol-phosphate-mannose--protein mannosyltransferase n=1 Tax=Nocardioides vastitatis TaxID=2568655 RepID=A0ABW0ZIR4_9ACTN|nr:phospholipid carrier-dependent glycosyltransferase [Nocardioides sp.]THJ02963.1 phospholipid carrier-dependent glycosyltransferase [Nocardioides sp.]